MKLTLKIAIALAVFATAATAYAEVPDVSKWSCPNDEVLNFPKYDMKVTICDSDGADFYVYIKVSDELVYVHEERKDADGKNVYYNALKTNKGDWVEVVNKNDLVWEEYSTESQDIEVSISNDNSVEVAKRIIPLLKK